MMLKLNYIKVIIPIQIDFSKIGFKTEEDKISFLQKMCEDSINKPITQDEKAIGVITESKINKTEDGIICGGSIWRSVNQEFIKRDDSSYELSGVELRSK